MEEQSLQFHVLSFEGPDSYSRAGGLASRVDGLTRALSGLGFPTHLWFIGDPERAGHERDGLLSLHRWAQWVSRYHPGGVYDGETGKQGEFSRTLPPFLFEEELLPHLRAGGRAVVLAEEWHTVDAVLHLRWLLRRAGWSERVEIFWNANNVFGFERIDWPRLASAATLTTVSRYMKHRMWPLGVDPLVIPNGLGEDSFAPPDRTATSELRRRFHDRCLLVKMARWDPDKRWLAAVAAVAAMKTAGWRPLLLARGGTESHGTEVLASLRASGLACLDCAWHSPGPRTFAAALRAVKDHDVVLLRSHVDAATRRTIFRAAEAVLANSGHEPFGLVGLETMAAGGLACTGSTGEDYVVPGYNALMLESGDSSELMGMLGRLRDRPDLARSIRRAGRATAERFSWPRVVERVLLPRVEIGAAPA